MPEFAMLHEQTKQLVRRVSDVYKSNHNTACLFFFKALVPDDGIIRDVTIISSVAHCMDRQHDESLINYLQQQKEHTLLSRGEFIDYKTNALIGCYLLKWQKYDGLVRGTLHDFLLQHFKKNLEINSITEFSDKFIDTCLVAFSQFCSFVYEQRAIDEYANLNNQLGISIQVEIHDARKREASSNSFLVDLVHVGFRAIRFS